MGMGVRALAVCAIVCVCADDAGAQGKVMTLADALARARTQAPQVVSARLAVEEARARLVGAAVRQANPVLDGWLGNRSSTSERFADFITAADEDGRLETWINEGIDALGDLGETALNVGKMFTGITGAADGSLLENLAKWTGQWQEFLNSPEGQEKLKNLLY